MDIIVTTPKTEQANAAREAKVCIASGGGYYFRKLPTRPKRLKKGDRLWYTESGFVTGFGTVCQVIDTDKPMHCEVTNRVWPAGVFVIIEADTWKWTEPLPYPPFMGYRYFQPEPDQCRVLGGWKDLRPILEEGEWRVPGESQLEKLSQES